MLDHRTDRADEALAYDCVRSLILCAMLARDTSAHMKYFERLGVLMASEVYLNASPYHKVRKSPSWPRSWVNFSLL